MNFTAEKPKDFALIGQLNRTLNKIEKTLENIEKPEKAKKLSNFSFTKDIPEKEAKKINVISDLLEKHKKSEKATKEEKEVKGTPKLDNYQNKLQALKEIKEKAEQKKREEKEEEFRNKQLELLSSIKQGIDEQVEEYKKKNFLEKLQEKTETKLNKISAKRDYKFAKNHSNLAEISENGLGSFLSKRIVSIFDKDLREQIKYEKQKRIIEAEKTYKEYAEKDEVLSNIDDKNKLEVIKAKRQKEAIAAQKFDSEGKVNKEFLELSKNSVESLKKELITIEKEKETLIEKQLELFQKGEKEQAVEMQEKIEELEKKFLAKQDALKGMQFAKEANQNDLNELDKDAVQAVKAVRDKKTTREILEEKKAKAKELLNSDKMVSGISAMKQGLKKLLKVNEETNKNIEELEDLQKDEIRATRKAAMNSSSGSDMDLDFGDKRSKRSKGWKKYLKKGGSLLKRGGSLATRAGGALLGTMGSMASGAVSTVSALATGGLSAGLEAGAAALATNPVGWAIAGALAVGAAGYGIYHLMIDDDSEEVVDRLEKLGAFDHSFLGNSEITKWEVVYALPKKDLNALERYDDFSDKTMKTIKELQKIPQNVREFLARSISNRDISADKDGILSVENHHLFQKHIRNAFGSKAFTVEEFLKAKVLFNKDDQKWIEDTFKSNKPKKQEQPKKDGKITEKDKSDKEKSKNDNVTKPLKAAALATPMGFVASKVGGAVTDFVKAHKETINKVGRAIFNVTPAGALYHLINGDTSFVDSLIDKGAIDHSFIGNSEIVKWEIIYNLDKNGIQALIDYDDWDKETQKTLNNLLKVDFKIRKFLSSNLVSKTLKANESGILSIINLKEFTNYLKSFKKKEKLSIQQAIILFDKKSAEIIKKLDKPIKRKNQNQKMEKLEKNPENENQTAKKATKTEKKEQIKIEKSKDKESKNKLNTIKSQNKDKEKNQIEKQTNFEKEPENAYEAHKTEIDLLQKEMIKAQKLAQRYELAAQGIVPITENDKHRQEILLKKAEKEKEKVKYIDKKLKSLIKPTQSKSTDLSINKTNPKIEKKEVESNKAGGTTAISQGSSNTTIINNYSNPFTSGLAVVTNNGV